MISRGFGSLMRWITWARASENKVRRFSNFEFRVSEWFDAPQMMAFAKLQAWKLKPAILAEGR